MSLDDAPPRLVPRPPARPVHQTLPYRVVLRCLQASWLCCTAGLVAMLPALVLRLPQLVVVFRLGLYGCFAAAGVAAVLFVPLAVRRAGHDLVGRSTFGRRADALTASLLADLLDGD